MTVYVDDMRRRARVGQGRPAVWSHLMADTHDELMAFAALLGLNPRWLQLAGTTREHFDVIDANRKRAIALGAKPIRYGGRQQRELLASKRAARAA